MRISSLCSLVFVIMACDSKPSKDVKAVANLKSAPEAAKVEVQHILVAFSGSLPGREVDRSLEEARKLALKISKKAKSSKDFEALVRAYSDDQIPGIYRLANTGLQPEGAEFARERMVKAFGDLAFSLKPGQVGLAEFHPTDSPYGFHIIKRLR